MFESLHQAYDEGKIDNQTLIERIKPLMYTRMRLGEFDPSEMNDYTKIPMDVIQCEITSKFSPTSNTSIICLTEK